MNNQRYRSGRAARGLMLMLFALGTAPQTWSQSPPEWWVHRGVVNPDAAADDYAAINQGQAKNLATGAYLELDGRVMGGAGPTLQSLVEGWTRSRNSDDFAALTAGQLKELSRPFHMRLVEVGAAASLPPWLASQGNPGDDFSVANIGQAKNAFSFSPANSAVTDSDRDGVPDWLEMYSNTDSTSPWLLPMSVLETPAFGYSKHVGTSPVNHAALSAPEQPSLTDAPLLPGFGRLTRNYLTRRPLRFELDTESTGPNGAPPVAAHHTSTEYKFSFSDWTITPYKWSIPGGGTYYCSGSVSGGLIRDSQADQSWQNRGVPDIPFSEKVEILVEKQDYELFLLDQNGNDVKRGSPTYVQITGNPGQYEISGIPVVPGGTGVFTAVRAISALPAYRGSLADRAGSEYRKVSLDGRLLPKPSPTDSIGGEVVPDEVALDAYTCRPIINTSDGVVPLGASALSLRVGRSLRPEVWSRRYGLLPHERYTLPFGVCWSSDLAPYLSVTYRAVSAVDRQQTKSADWDEISVMDEQGATFNFLRKSDASGNYFYVATGEEPNSVSVAQAQLSEQWIDGEFYFCLEKRYGTKCYFEHPYSVEIQKLVFDPPVVDREIHGDWLFAASRLGGDLGTKYYGRIQWVEDIHGNQLVYEFDDNDVVPRTLVPRRIYDPDRVGECIWIVQDKYGLIKKVKMPDGAEIDYTYENKSPFADAGLAPIWALTKVSQNGEEVLYDYEVVQEHTPELPFGDRRKYNYHADLVSMSRPQGLNVAFEYAYNHDNLVEVDYPGASMAVWEKQVGQPRVLATVTLSGGIQTSVTRTSNLALTRDGTLLGSPTVISTFIGPLGNMSFQFTEPNVFHPVPDLETLLGSVNFTDIARTSQEMTEMSIESMRSAVVTFTRMEVTTSLGTATVTFNEDAGMAPRRINDEHGAATIYQYNDRFYNGSDPGWYAWWDGSTQLVRAAEQLYYSEPTSITNALGEVTTLAYTPGFRKLASVRDSRGVRTAYDYVDDRLVEEKTFLNDVLQRRIVHKYLHGAFPAFRTSSEIVRLGSDPALSAQTGILTTFTPDAQGRVHNTTRAGLTSSVDYDLNGRVTVSVDPKGSTTRYKYTPRGRLEKVTLPSNIGEGEVAMFYTYDGLGNLIRETNPLGVATFHQYDVFGRRTKTTLDLNGSGTADGRIADMVEDWSYYPNGLLHTSTDTKGTVTTYGYDSHGRRISETKSSAQVRYDFVGSPGGTFLNGLSSIKPSRVTDPRGIATSTGYDLLYRPLTVTVSGGGGITRSQYDGSGNVRRTTDRYGNVTLTAYDALNRPTTVTHPDQKVTVTKYASWGPIWYVRDEMDREIRTSFSPQGLPTILHLPPVTVDGQLAYPEKRFQYDPNGNLVVEIDELGFRTCKYYDVRNQLRIVRSPGVRDNVSGKIVFPEQNTNYDKLGRVTSVTDPAGNRTTHFYDRAGRKTRTILPPVKANGTPAQISPDLHWGYDKAGNITTQTDANGHVTHNSYDQLNRMTDSTDPLGHVTHFGYDGSGNRTSILDADGFFIRFEYDSLNRVLWEGPTEMDAWATYSYDGNTQETTRTDGKGRLIVSSFDARSRLTTVKYFADSAARDAETPQNVRTYHYLDDGLVSSVTESADAAASVAYTYDEVGRLASETSSGVTTRHGYDLKGNPTGYSIDGMPGATLTRHFDSLGRIIGIVNEDKLTRHFFDVNGREVERYMPNGLCIKNSWDAQGRLTARWVRTQTNAALGLEPFCRIDFEHYPNGNIASMEEIWRASPIGPARFHRTTMGYDAADRLTLETFTTQGGGGRSTIYTYSDSGDRETKVVTGSEPESWIYTHNHYHQLTGAVGTVGTDEVSHHISFIYDADGNRTSRTENGVETHSYQWDANNRLTGVAVAATGAQTAVQHGYGYDYRTRRIRRTEAGLTTQAAFSGGLSVAEFEGAQNPPGTVAPVPSVLFVRGADMGGGVGGLAYSMRGTRVRFNLSNGRGDVIAQFDPGAQLAWTGTYEAFGKRPVETGENLDRQRANTKEEDPTGLLCEGFRYRDLETGTWLSRDPAGVVDGPNLYAYVKQNPWTAFDPLGLAALPPDDPSNLYVPDTNYVGATDVMQALQGDEQAIDKYEASRSMVNEFAEVADGVASMIPPAAFGVLATGETPSGRRDVSTVEYMAAAATVMVPIARAVGLGRAAVESTAFADDVAVGAAKMDAIPVTSVAAKGGGAGPLRGATHANAHGHSIRSINPLRGDLNCGPCAIAVDSTLAGRAATALNTGRMPFDDMAAHFGASWSPLNQTGVVRHLTEAGAGSRGIVMSRFRTSTGWDYHYFNAVNQKGAVRFLDGQAGGAADLSTYQIISFLPTH